MKIRMPETKFRNLLMLSPDFFEELVLAGMIASQRFFDKNAPSLKLYKKLMFERSKFSSMEASQLFEVICMCRDSHSEDGLGEEPIPLVMLKY